MAGGASSGGETVVPVGQGGHEKITGLIVALSEIQKLYRREQDGNQIAWEQVGGVGKTLEYFTAGFKAAMVEGMIFLLIVILALPVLSDPWLRSKVAIVLPLVKSEIMVWFISVLPICTMACFCMYLSTYNVGTSTRKAINSFLSGRLSALMIKGLISFFVLAGLSISIQPESAAELSRIITGRKEEAAYRMFQVIMGMKVPLMERAFEVNLILAAGVLTPFLTVWGVKWYRDLMTIYNKRKWRDA